MDSCILEVCIDSLESALIAIRSGALRLEVCSSLSEGGLTPSNGLVQSIRDYLQQHNTVVQLLAMIRPRSGDFHYSFLDVQQMKSEIVSLKPLVDGFVFGCLLSNGQLDEPTAAELLKLCKPKQVTFHRAFDVAADPILLIDQLAELKFDRILTSGQASSAANGCEQLIKFIDHASDRIVILPGCGINSSNIGTLAQRLKVEEFHSSGQVLHKTRMHYVNSELYPSTNIGNTYDFKRTSSTEVKAMVAVLRARSKEIN